jgi:CO/xanthine dehydrogenase FAD-binding subunit
MSARQAGIGGTQTWNRRKIMKPPPFEYYAPSTLDEALRLLRDLGPDARPLAGGQSLVPMMNFRLVRPRYVIDLNRIPNFGYVRLNSDVLQIGAMTRHREVEHSEVIKNQWPLLAEVMKHVAHVQIRSRGTIGGSLSHADPSAELPAAIAALEGTLILRSHSGTRRLRPHEYFMGALTTAAEPDELLVEIQLPTLPAGTSAAFDELSRRRGDFAIVGVATVVKCNAVAEITFARLTFTGVGEKYFRAHDAEEYLVGRKATSSVIAEAARMATSTLDPPSDIHASSNYRRQTAEVVAERVMARAIGQQGVMV